MTVAARSALSCGVEILAAQHEASASPGYDVVVVGSGYGGAVAAARLSGMRDHESQQPFSVCVLERGKEYVPGDFPSNWPDFVNHLRLSGGGMSNVPSMPEGLFDFKTGGDVLTLVANGLGGGSLINAGVCEQAESAVFNGEAWPEPWRGNTARWKTLYQRAAQQLGAHAWPANRLNKQQAMQRFVDSGEATRRPIHLTIVPPQTAEQATDALPSTLKACVECGDCFTGCNVGAKITLSHNYLKQAFEQGTDIFTGATVRSVQALEQNHPMRQAHGWRWGVHYVLTNGNKLPGGLAEYVVYAKHVVLSAGTFGSTEILLRSRNRGLSVSGRLGDGFSGNGDVVTTFYNGHGLANACPDASEPLDQRQAGPTITAQISWRQPVTSTWTRMTMQELTVPSGLSWVFKELITTMLVPQRWTQVNWHTIQPGDTDPFATDEAAFQRTLLTVTYIDDGAMGRLEPSLGFDALTHDGGLEVRWKDVGKLPALEATDQFLKQQSLGHYAAYLRNPLYQFMPQSNFMGLGQTDRRALSVHPLGGCRMAETAVDGVVDPFGRVFLPNVDLNDPTKGEALRMRLTGFVDRALHEGLYVLDGSIIPSALGINPLLTITALAEGAIDEWAEQCGWRSAAAVLRKTETSPAPCAALAPQNRPTAVRFSERMVGNLNAHSSLRPSTLTMRVYFDGVDDLTAFIQNPLRNSGLKATFRVIEPPNTNPWIPALPNHAQAGSKVLKIRGRVHWLNNERSHVIQRLGRSIATYFKHRYQADRAESLHRKRPTFEGVWSKLIGATHFGAVKQLAYEFMPLPAHWPLGEHPDHPGELVGLPQGTVLHGAKRLGYLNTDKADVESSNPWHQLIHLKLKAKLPPSEATFVLADGKVMHRLSQDSEIELGTLVFDELAMMDRYTAPLTITAQQDGLSALRDLSRLGLFFTRTLFGLHMLSFRRPEYPVETYGHRPRNRLPALHYPAHDVRYANMHIERHTVTLQLGTPVHLLLTRFKPSTPSSKEPVLLIHGFGSGGIQFTHSAIREPMAPWLARQGLDVWVADLRTSIGLPTSHQQWVMDDVAQQDIPALIDEIRRVTGQQQVSVIAHCIGSAMFCMSVLAGKLKGKIAKATLMQVGPHAELPRASRARGYIGSRVQLLLGFFEAQSVASQKLNDAEPLMDRLLGTYLYPPDQRPFYRRSKDLQHNTRIVNANRSAGIFGQLFQWQNMNPEVMDAMEDLLGHCNLTTYSQTTQFVYNRRLMDLAGNDRYVTQAHITEGFTFPTLLVHGENNQTFSPRTLRRNEQLLKRAGVAVSTLQVPGHGHLDCVVGQDIAQLIFPSLLQHLHTSAHDLPAPTAHAPFPCELRLPDVGPWLGHIWPPNDACAFIRLRVGLRIEDLGREFKGVAAVACIEGQTLHAYPQCWSQADWPSHEGIIEILVDPAWLVPGKTLEILVAAVHHEWPCDASNMRQQVKAKYRAIKASCLDRGIPIRAIEGLRLSTDWLQQQLSHAGDLRLILGACRQRPLLVDRDLADQSMKAIRAKIQSERVDALILCGDQIYADSRTDSAHPMATEGIFIDAHREAWTSPYQRDVFRRITTYMVQDDHEYRNDYNMALAASRPREYRFAQDVFSRYQVNAGPDRKRPGLPDALWFTLSRRGHECFMADTRNERFDPPTIDRQHARIMRESQMLALQAWLVAQHKREIEEHRCIAKLIVTSVPVAPLFQHAMAHPSYGIRTDGWERFPQSLADLLGWIALNGIQNVVFLAGDYHHSADVDIQVKHADHAEVKIRSIVTGGLYSPYPFANAKPEDWLNPQGQWLALGKDTTWTYTVRSATPGNGYTDIHVDTQGQVTASFVVCS